MQCSMHTWLSCRLKFINSTIQHKSTEASQIDKCKKKKRRNKNSTEMEFFKLHKPFNSLSFNSNSNFLHYFLFIDSLIASPDCNYVQLLFFVYSPFDMRLFSIVKLFRLSGTKLYIYYSIFFFSLVCWLKTGALTHSYTAW